MMQEHTIVVLKAQNRLLASDNTLLQKMLREKNNEILLLKREIRRLNLQIPKKMNETQLCLDAFI